MLQTKTMRLGLMVVLVGFLSSGGTCQDATPTIKAVGMNIGLADPDSEYGGSYVLGRSAGIEITFMVEDKNSFFVSVIDEGKEKSDLSLVVDGKKLDNTNSFSRIGFMSSISDNGQRVTVPVSATQLPPKGATSVKVTGKLVLMAGADEKTDKVSFKVAVGETVQLGPISTKISSVDEYDFGETVTNIAFETNQSMDVISSLKFLDENGKELETNSGGSSSFGFGDQMTYMRAFQVAGKPTALTAQVKYFGSTQTLTVPVDLDVDLSLSSK